MKTLFSPILLLVALLLAGSETALGQCTYTTIRDGNFNDPTIYATSGGSGCPSLPASLSTIIINHQVTLNQNFTVSGTTNNKTSGSIIISPTGSLLEDATSRTLTISHGILRVQAVANRSVPRLRISVLEVAYTQRGNFDALVSLEANSAVQVTCLMIGNQGGIELAENALLTVAGNIDVSNGNGSIEGTGSGLRPAGTHVVGVFTGVNGGTHNVFSGNLLVCIEGKLGLGSCPSTGPMQTAPASNDPTCGQPLPVTLVRFTAQALPSGVKLDWATATELNNDYFEVQRSADGRVFAPIGRVPGAGNTSSGATYSFTDTAPLPGSGYYRLRQTDHDGSEVFSAVAVATGRQQLEARIYPNPGTTTITLPAGAEQAIRYRIYTATGRTVLAGHGAGGTALDVQQIPAGLYLLELLTDGQRHVQRFVRQ
ncbi:T9SS type A sorting domain-containing protein [Hymenobacter psychrophilus]|uniref:Por secretion system C-terminal sorting domain-containing protein n=1 Tax=Hymenobacter psychrophilus TaxID=651662 RepID=A0A1H3FHH8_9BACT|nr:T9SS type A sorting domain-containing protein [Hymenobacter psychrophilus]SDX90390.1 Por secretion system C-terminal sorting domain-containing protein [Hymenobacter psychrophilus]